MLCVQNHGHSQRGAGSDHLSAAKAKHILLHLPEALQAELQADVEEQEHHSQLCKVPHSLHVFDDAQSMRPNERPASLQPATGFKKVDEVWLRFRVHGLVIPAEADKLFGDVVHHLLSSTASMQMVYGQRLNNMKVANDTGHRIFARTSAPYTSGRATGGQQG